MFLCVCNNSKTNFIPQPQEYESCRRQPQCSNTQCGGLCTQPIWCCPLQPFQMLYFVVHFWSKILLFLCACQKSKITFIPQPQEKKSCRRQTQCSYTLYGFQCTRPIWCCPLQPFQMRYFVVHYFWSKILLFLCACHKSVMNFILQPQEKKSCRMPTQSSSILCGW